jgi:hypothetical protein
MAAMVLLLVAHCTVNAGPVPVVAPTTACPCCCGPCCGRRPGLLARLRARFRHQQVCPDGCTAPRMRRRPIHHLVAELQCRYGPRGGVVVAIAAAAFAAIPFPGTTLIPFGIAELARRRTRHEEEAGAEPGSPGDPAVPAADVQGTAGASAMPPEPPVASDAAWAARPVVVGPPPNPAPPR